LHRAAATAARARSEIVGLAGEGADDQATAAHRAQIEQQKAQTDAIHLQVKAQAEIELARIKAE